MKSQNTVTFVIGDDWEGLYINGILKAEDHVIHATHVLEAIPIDYTFVDLSEIEGGINWLHDQGNLPFYLSKVPTSYEDIIIDTFTSSKEYVITELKKLKTKMNNSPNLQKDIDKIIQTVELDSWNK